MTHTSPEYVPSDMSIRNLSIPPPGPATGRPAAPRNAVQIRTHPPLHAGDFNNNLSRDMYWWEKLDKDEPEEKRVLEAMYYGQERQPRCNVCEKQNRACMWFLGEEDQSNKSCVKCRRVHATCKTIGSLENSVDDVEDQSCIEVHKSAHARAFSQKRKASEYDESDKIETQVKRTRSSLRAKSVRELAYQDSESDEERPLNKQYLGNRKNETPLHVGSSWVDPDSKLEEESQANFHTDQSSTTKRSDGRSMTIGRDEDPLQGMVHDRNQYRLPQNPTPDGKSSGLSQIESGLSALLDERLSKELQKLKATFQTEMIALRTSVRDLAQNRGGSGLEEQMKEMETQIEDERATRLRLEDENMRLKNRMSRLEARQVAGMNDLQDQIRQL